MRRIAILLFVTMLGGCIGSAPAPSPYPLPKGEGSNGAGTSSAPRPSPHPLPSGERGTTADAALTLDDAYRMVLDRSETLALDAEELARIQALYEQAFGSILPRLSFKGSYTRQDPVESSGAGSSARNANFAERTEYKFSVRQPLFSGLKEFYAMRQTRAASEAKQESIGHARLRLYADVAEAFTAVLQSDRALSTMEDSLRLAEERLEELKARRRVGISRHTEVLAQEAEVASTRAQAEELRGARAVAWEALKFLTGLHDERALADAVPEPGDLPPVAALLTRASQGRTDLRALQKEIEATGESVGIARSGYFPTLSLEGNRYTHREGNSKDVDWDLTITGEVPIFDGATTQARIREARSNVRSAQLRLDLLRRQIVLEVSRAYADVVSLRSELESREKAVASAEEFYELVQAEYRRDIATNIEVLTAFNTLQRARLDRDRARFQYRLAGVRLAVECGELPGEAKGKP